MRFGLALPHYGFSFPDGGPLTWERLVSYARRAEALGFDSVWISDHFFLDLARYGGPSEPYGAAEPFTSLAGLAVVTDRVRLGTLVAGAPFRHPAHVAKMATAIDLFSGGRFDLGLGAGWYEREFRAFGYDFGTTGERFDVLEEAVAVVAALFGETEPVDHQGARFRLDSAFNRPRPAQPGGPPIWIGSKGGARSFRLVARYASGWNTVWRWEPGDYAGLVERLAGVCEAEGRDPRSVRRSVGLYTLVGEDERDLRSRWRALQGWAPGGALEGVTLEEHARGGLVGTPARVIERVAEFEALGVEEIVVAPASLPFAIFDDGQLELIGERVLGRRAVAAPGEPRSDAAGA